MTTNGRLFTTTNLPWLTIPTKHHQVYVKMKTNAWGVYIYKKNYKSNSKIRLFSLPIKIGNATFFVTSQLPADLK